MQVQDHRYIVLVGQYLLQYVPSIRVDELPRLSPGSIWIQSYQLSPAIPMDDAIHVDHRHNFKHIIMKLLPRPIRGLSLCHQRKKIVQNSLNHITRSRLSRMLPREHPHNLTLLNRPPSCRNRYQINPILTQSLTNRLYCKTFPK